MAWVLAERERFFVHLSNMRYPDSTWIPRHLSPPGINPTRRAPRSGRALSFASTQGHPCHSRVLGMLKWVSQHTAASAAHRNSEGRDRCLHGTVVVANQFQGRFWRGSSSGFSGPPRQRFGRESRTSHDSFLYARVRSIFGVCRGPRASPVANCRRRQNCATIDLLKDGFRQSE